MKEATKTKTGILWVGNICPTVTRSNPNQGRVYDPRGLSPTIPTCVSGGNLQPMVIIYESDSEKT